MPFNSLTFLVFFVCVLFVHYLPLSWRVRKFNLLIASYLFYAAWNPPFIVLLWISTAVAFVTAKGMAASNTLSTRRLFLGLSLLIDLGLLGYFKYASFALDTFTRLAHSVGIAYQPPALDIVLPIGISFYTFHTLSYTIDIYRGQIAPCRSLLDFSLYVAFFPQLVAGPIVRARQFLPQCAEPKWATRAQFAWGLNLLILGLFSKCVLADKVFRPVADAVFQPNVHPDTMSACGGMLAFAGQVYCDFAGYSTCAVGVALCLGFALPDNFRWPFGAIGFSDFWRRWHITLTTWMRDYVYASIGGSGSMPRVWFSIFITMVLVGLWHGPSWTFVVFGAIHGVAVATEGTFRIWFPNRRIHENVLVQLTLCVLTVFAVAWTVIFFRASTLEQGGQIAAAALGWGPRSDAFRLSDVQLLCAVVPYEIMVITHFSLRDSSLEEIAFRWPRWIWGTLVAVMLMALFVMPGDERAFVYFQF
jgi:alginate O-acetyltransferase complex protein AlgI